MGDCERTEIDGKVAIVTGAGGGLGARYAHIMGSRGAMVLVNDPGTNVVGDGQDQSPAPWRVEAITTRGRQAAANFDDVSTQEGARRIIAQAIDTFDGLHIVANT